MASGQSRVEGLDGLSAALNHIRHDTALFHQGTALFEGALVLERGVKEWIKAWHLIDTNHYRNSIKAVSLDSATAAVYTEVIYAAIHEMGGTIVPKRKPALVFKIGKGSDATWVRTQKVTMPARPHWRPAIRTGSNKIIKAIAASLIESCQEAARKGMAKS